jgi:hypothetical protein
LKTLARKYVPHALALVQGNEFNIKKIIDLVERLQIALLVMEDILMSSLNVELLAFIAIA